MTPDDEHRHIREGAAIGATADRHQIAVTGKDRAEYLQGLLTNDIPALAAGAGCYAAWLSPQGRMLTDMHVLASETMMLIDVPAATARQTAERLEQFIFTEDVQVASLDGQLATVWVHGPLAAGTLEQALEGASALAEWSDYHHAIFQLGRSIGPALQSTGPAKHSVSVARIDQLGVPGYCAYVEPALAPTLTQALQAAGAAVVSAAAIDAARVEAAYPLFGVDMNDDIIPLEAGIEARAISFSKGCYVGQEIVIRVMHRGQGRVARKLVSLRFHGEPAAPSSRLHAGTKDVGFVTSAAHSPRYGAIGLGYVHRDFVEPGSELAEATVIRRPIS